MKLSKFQLKICKFLQLLDVLYYNFGLFDLETLTLYMELSIFHFGVLWNCFLFITQTIYITNIEENVKLLINRNCGGQVTGGSQVNTK